MLSVCNDSHSDRHRPSLDSAWAMVLLACCAMLFGLPASSISTSMLAKQRESTETLGPPQWAIMTNDAGISFSHEFGGGVGDFVSESGGSGGAWLDLSLIHI